MVSVRLMTYNHGPFIQQALEGIFMQKIDFPIEVVVGDDFSEDDTLDIVRRHPNSDTIEIIILERRVGDKYWVKRQKHGRLYNFRNILEHCKGKYVALLDGDDYWTDEFKLKKQVDFLESNLDYSMCFHQAQLLSVDGSLRPFNNFLKNSTFGFSDLLERNFVATASCVFRNSYNPLPDWFENLQAGDWGLHLINASTGKVFYFNDPMSIYRIHNDGFWSKLSTTEMILRHIRNFEILDKGFNYRYHREFNNAIKVKRKLLSSSKFPKKQFIHLGQKIMKFLRAFV